MSDEGRRISDSRVTLSVVMGPQDTNSLGNVHGGVIMKLVDEAAGLAALRHSRRPAVTVAIDSMTFMHPIHVGMLVTFTAELTYVGRTSMEVRVEVITENPLEGTSRLSNTAYLVFVALGDDGRPIEVQPLIFETEDQHRRAEQAKERQVYRKQQRSREAQS
ncbi:MAG: acyl-CoA thioesterase [Chloroflexota bacterium]